MLLADSDLSQIIGTVEPQGPIAHLTLSVILGWGIRLFFFLIGILALYYLLMGAFEWVNSGGEEKKVADARQKITQSLIGMLIALVVLVGWVFVSSQILGIFRIENGQITIKIPSINCKGAGSTYTNVAECCSQLDDGAGKCK